MTTPIAAMTSPSSRQSISGCSFFESGNRSLRVAFQNVFFSTWTHLKRTIVSWWLLHLEKQNNPSLSRLVCTLIRFRLVDRSTHYFKPIAYTLWVRSIGFVCIWKCRHLLQSLIIAPSGFKSMTSRDEVDWFPKKKKITTMEPGPLFLAHPSCNPRAMGHNLKVLEGLTHTPISQYYPVEERWLQL
jgi:hypothetical protein